MALILHRDFEKRCNTNFKTVWDLSHKFRLIHIYFSWTLINELAQNVNFYRSNTVKQQHLTVSHGGIGFSGIRSQLSEFTSISLK